MNHNAAQWYCVRLSAGQLAAGEKRRLAKKATEMYLSLDKPPRFAVFATGLSAEGSVEVYFSPEAAAQMEGLLQSLNGQPCPRPSGASEDLAMIAGDLSEKFELLS